ncbi:hypothetical protein FUAX_04290 [Fulvitalea axinellae]|uniref:Uncharacterized protein n=1 Tax=Fulvitalea axinellae TaxID=1182444 RepID=A0AAU9CM85_9BACT|nr:hypothetical protein FUAX_04290 [Fulvitalea axinellae]
MIEFIKKKIKSIEFISDFYRTIRYACFRYFIRRKFQDYYTSLGIREVILPNKKEGISSFFGYYNISPWNLQGDIIFGESVASVEPRGSLCYDLNIKLYNSKSGRIETVAKTRAWNWQQGAMLQWLGGANNKIIFNDYESGKGYRSRIINLQTNEEETIDFPIYSVSSDGRFALTLSFERLAVMRPDYGYFNHDIESFNFLSLSDGISRIDLSTNRCHQIISLKELTNFMPCESMTGATHKVNHVDISPNGKRAMFLHRWIGPKGRFTRLMTCNVDGSGLYLLCDTGMVSHCCWEGNERIIGFCKSITGLDHYVRFEDKKGELEIVAQELLTSDGHPSVSPDGKWMLTDTYPGLDRMSGLYLLCLKGNKKGRLIRLGEFYQPLKFVGENRVDLHPKWSKDGRFVGIDSAHTGKRGFHVYHLEEEVFDEA